MFYGLLNDLSLRKCLKLKTSTPTPIQKSNFDNFGKSTANYSLEKPIYFISQICFQYCVQKLLPDARDLILLYSLSFQKTSLLLKLIFAATQFLQRPNFKLFEKALFCILVASINLVLKASLAYRRAVFMKNCYFFC